MQGCWHSEHFFSSNPIDNLLSVFQLSTNNWATIKPDFPLKELRFEYMQFDVGHDEILSLLHQVGTKKKSKSNILHTNITLFRIPLR